MLVFKWFQQRKEKEERKKVEKAEEKKREMVDEKKEEEGKNRAKVK